MADAILCSCTVCGKGFTPKPHKSNKYCGMPCYRAAQRAGEYKRGHGPEFPRAPCHHCGVTVERIPSQKRNGEQSDKVFCSRDCYDASRTAERQKRARQCPHCCEAFIPDGDSKYCSEVCWKAAKKAKPKRCLNCECLFTPVKRHPSGRMISHNSGKVCSAECQIAWIRNNETRKQKIGEAFRGEKHPNWQGGKSMLNNISNRGPNWQRQRRSALKRDGHRCVDCQMTEDESRNIYGRSLDVDHIIPFHNFDSYKKANVLSNLACRCASCHRIAEAKRGMVQMVLPMQDSAKRMHKGYCQGERVKSAKLTELDVRRIRQRACGGETAASIHADYQQVHRSAVQAIIVGKSWRHVA